MTTRKRITKTRLRSYGVRIPGPDEDAVMMEDDDGDSVATTMGVKADKKGVVVRTPRDLESVNGSVTGNSLVLSKPLAPDNDGDLMEDDDISTLTEYSMEDEDDNISHATQNTAWTAVTTGTDSTTVPTRNFLSGDKKIRINNGKRPSMNAYTLVNHNKLKRRRLS